MRILMRLVVVLGVFMIPVAQAHAYSDVTTCMGCHTEFGGPGAATHNLHNQFINACTWCHTSTGDTPKTGSSGLDPDHGCSGCHVVAGTVLHHQNAGTASCSCHGTPTMGTEDTLPPYYGTAATILSKTCTDNPNSGGEDWSGDGFGIDNDGDLLYDHADTDCPSVPNEVVPWSMIKQMWGSE